ncbi:MAG: YggS family pyridoxal phosphate-dependent enzyme [Bacteroides sp.]|nr:YggS family pyridoxal phosphate-dependent enzyme [Bacteroides sp.]
MTISLSMTDGRAGTGKCDGKMSQDNGIRENMERVRTKISDVCAASGRDVSEVTLIAVSKTKPVELLREAYAAGARDFGENKVQELLDKIPQMPSDIRWHMIGHLQRNKVKYIVDKVYMIHSVDSLRLAEEISREAVKRDITVNILVEVNVAREESKFGVLPEEAQDLVSEIAKLPGIRIKGLMTIAPFVENAEENRPHFQKLRELSVDIMRKNTDNRCMGNIMPAGADLPMDSDLSMGMTGDYAVAVEEGATYVRVGTGIFGERDYKKES